MEATPIIPSTDAVASAIRRMSPEEIARRTAVVRDYAIALPAVNGRSAALDLSQGNAEIQVRFEKRFASFKLNGESWRRHFLAFQTDWQPSDVRPTDGSSGDRRSFRSHDDGHGAAATRRWTARLSGGKTTGPSAGTFSATSTLLHSPLRKEFVNLPSETSTYTPGWNIPWVPEGRRLLSVMQHGRGNGRLAAARWQISWRCRDSSLLRPISTPGWDQTAAIGIPLKVSTRRCERLEN